MDSRFADCGHGQSSQKKKPHASPWQRVDRAQSRRDRCLYGRPTAVVLLSAPLDVHLTPEEFHLLGGIRHLI